MGDVVRAGTSSLRMRMLGGGVLLLEMSGLLTAKAMQEFAARSIRAHGHEARGFVLDYRQGALLATAYELERLVSSMEPGTPICRPVAFVTTAGNADLMVTHAKRIASLGIWRRVFYSVEPARAWVSSKTA